MSIRDDFDFDEPVSAVALYKLMRLQPNGQHFKRNVSDWLAIQVPVEREVDERLDKMDPDEPYRPVLEGDDPAPASTESPGDGDAD